MRTQLRIVAGSLRGRKVTVQVSASLRPTPQMVREALFSILGNAVPDRPFFDVFAGTGVVGLEALSRGASRTTFVERDFRLIADLEKNLSTFRMIDQSIIARTDVYRWGERWQPPAEPVTVFLSPPFADFAERNDEMMAVLALMQHRVAPGSVIVLQAENGAELGALPDRPQWDERRYGRNLLLFWDKAASTEAVESPDDALPVQP
jgi:16S rRNA (guanine(966)-N(2))-methyltransferase RsmD